MSVKIPRKKQLLQCEEERGCLGRAVTLGPFLLLSNFRVHAQLWVPVRQPWDDASTAFSKMQLHPARVGSAEYQNTAMRACVLLCVPAGEPANPLEGLHMHSRGNDLSTLVVGP